MRYIHVCLLCFSLFLGLAACKSTSSSSSVSGFIDRQVGDPIPDPNNPSLSVNGSAPAQAKVGESYSFRPVLATLSARGHTFTVDNLPDWLSFNTRTGEIKGVPEDRHIGRYDGILIAVHDGFRRLSLPAFSIEVVGEGALSIQLSWYPPDENVDGSPLSDLAGYIIQYGREPGEPTRVIDIDDPSATSHLVEGLVAGTYHITMFAYNSLGVGGEPSPEAAVLLE